MDEKIAGAFAAMSESEALRARLRRRCLTPETGLGERERQLIEQRLALSAAREPLRRHLLHAPKWSGESFAPEVRAASGAITRERKRLERMLYGKPGRAGWQRSKTARPKVTLNPLKGTVREARGVLSGLADELGPMEKLASINLPLDVGFSLAADAAAIATRAHAARLRIARAQQRLKASQAFAKRPYRDLDALDRRANATKKALHKIERRAHRIAATGPDRRLRPQREWTRAEAIASLDKWAARNEGRWPKARDLPAHKMLPSRGTLGNLRISLVQDAPQTDGRHA